MADPLKTTVAIVATPKAMEDVRSRLREAGIRTGQVEVAAVRVERESTPDRTVPVLVNRRAALLGAGSGAALGLLLVAGWMGLVAAGPALLGTLGGGLVGGLFAAVGSAVLTAGSVAPTKTTRDYWKIRVLGDANLLARARGLASRSGVTLRRLATDAFEVQVPPPVKRTGKR